MSSIDVNAKIGPPSEDRNYIETDVPKRGKSKQEITLLLSKLCWSYFKPLQLFIVKIEP